MNYENCFIKYEELQKFTKYENKMGNFKKY
jgi:hypothetical protein